MRKIVTSALVCFVFTVLAGFQPGPALGAEKIGVVLLNGKDRDFLDVVSLADHLSDAGVIVKMPLTAWSQQRIYDKTYEQALKEVDGTVADLKSDGAKRIFIAGHGLGANVALGYGANRQGLSGLIMLAPAHFTTGKGFRKRLGGDVERARRMVNEGKGKEVGDFLDIIRSKDRTHKISAEIYFSWFEPRGPANMKKNAKMIGDVPVLWVAGQDDRLASKVLRKHVFNKLPGNPKTRFELIDSYHAGTPEDGKDAVLKWLKSFE